MVEHTMKVPLPEGRKLMAIQEINRFCNRNTQHPVQRRLVEVKSEMHMEMVFTSKSDATLFKLSFNV